MPAYPFKTPSLREFIQIAKRYGVVATNPAGPVLTLQNAQIATPFFSRRDSNGKTYAASMPGTDLDQCLNPSVVRSLCARLNVPPADFGLSLDDSLLDESLVE